MEKTEVILEPSTNTHKMVGDVKQVAKTDEMNGVVLEVNGNGIVLHGEHGVIVTEAKHVVKLTMQELNPVTREMVNSFD